MTKLEIAKAVALALEIKLKLARVVVDATVDTIADAIVTEKRVTLQGLGSFGIRHKKARSFRLPRSGDIVELPAKDVCFFKASTTLAKRINGEQPDPGPEQPE